MSSNPDENICQIPLLGLARAGKTTLAVQAVSHFPQTQYSHTSEEKVYLTNIQALLDKKHPLCYKKLKAQSLKTDLITSPEENNDSYMPVTTRVKLIDTVGENPNRRFKKRLSNAELAFCFNDRSILNDQRESMSRSATYHDDGEYSPLLQNDFQRPSPSPFGSIKKSDGYIILFDITNRNSYNKAIFLINAINSQEDRSVDTPIAVIGNKQDVYMHDNDLNTDLENDCLKFIQGKSNTLFYVGSILKNELYVAGASELGVYTIDQMLSKLVSKAMNINVPSGPRYSLPVKSSAKDQAEALIKQKFDEHPEESPLLIQKRGTGDEENDSQLRISDKYSCCRYLSCIFCPCFREGRCRVCDCCS